MKDKTLGKRQQELKRRREIEKNRQLILDAEHKKDALSYIVFVFIAILAVASVLFIYDAATFDGVEYKFPLTGEYGTFKYLGFTIGSFSLSYSFISIGFIFTFLSSFMRGRKYQLNIFSAILIPVMCYAVALVGAKTLFAFEKVLGTHSFKNLDFTGLSLYGSIYLSVVAGPIIALIFKMEIRKTYDFAAVFGFILLAFARMSCFTTGCCNSKQFLINGNTVMLPVQLFDASWALILLFLSLRAEAREKRSLFGFRPYTFLIIGYPLFRFFLEYVRTNKPVFLGLTLAQCHSIVFLIIGTVFFIYDNVPKKQKTE